MAFNKYLCRLHKQPQEEVQPVQDQAEQDEPDKTSNLPTPNANFPLTLLDIDGIPITMRCIENPNPTESFYVAEEYVHMDLWQKIMPEHKHGKYAEVPDCMEFIRRLNDIRPDYKFMMVTQKQWELSQMPESIDHGGDLIHVFEYNMISSERGHRRICLSESLSIPSALVLAMGIGHDAFALHLACVAKADIPSAKATVVGVGDKGIEYASQLCNTIGYVIYTAICGNDELRLRCSPVPNKFTDPNQLPLTTENIIIVASLADRFSMENIPAMAKVARGSGKRVMAAVHMPTHPVEGIDQKQVDDGLRALCQSADLIVVFDLDFCLPNGSPVHGHTLLAKALPGGAAQILAEHSDEIERKPIADMLLLSSAQNEDEIIGHIRQEYQCPCVSFVSCIAPIKNMRQCIEQGLESLLKINR